MAHELSIRENGNAEMAYVGETPWHGLGQRLEKGASIDTWKAAAGMDWKIRRSRVRFGEGENQVVWGDRHVLFRSDNKKPLGVVSSDYKAVQPGEVLEFFRDLVAGNGFTLETAGTLFDGKRMWALAHIGEDAIITGRDEVGGFLLLCTACDGSMSTTGAATAIRVVCNNTMSMALSAMDKKECVVRVPHSTTFNAAAMKDRLGIARDNFRKFVLASRDLANKRLQDNAASKFVADLLLNTQTVTAKKEPEKAVLTSGAYNRIMGLFNGEAIGSDMPSAAGTAWGMVNAVTEYVDHRSRAASSSNRMASAWFGAGDQLKTAAMEAALAL